MYLNLQFDELRLRNHSDLARNAEEDHINYCSNRHENKCYHYAYAFNEIRYSQYPHNSIHTDIIDCVLRGMDIVKFFEKILVNVPYGI